LNGGAGNNRILTNIGNVLDQLVAADLNLRAAGYLHRDRQPTRRRGWSRRGRWQFVVDGLNFGGTVALIGGTPPATPS